MKKTALVIGASGLVGTALVEQLTADPAFGNVKAFVRRKIPAEHAKLEQIIIDFNAPEKHSEMISGDVVFCAMGTTIKTAGSKEAFAKVDYTYVYNFAHIAKQNGIPRFVLVSSIGVTEHGNGSNFYLTVKRDVENALRKLKFPSLIIVRPSMLLGDRKEFRLGERIAKVLMKGLGFLFLGKLKKYKAIEASVVARAMILLSKTDLEEVSVFESDRLQKLGAG